MPIRVLIVDDSRSYLDAACALLEREGLEVVGVASTSAAALQQARALEPDVVLVDISLGEESGFELARRLVENDPDDQAALVLISTRAEADFEDLIAESPAVGFLAKADLSADALRGILDGRSR